MADSPEFLAQSTEELAAARAETRSKYQGVLADTEERKFYKVILLDLQKQMEVSQNVVRTLHSDPTFNSDKDSVVEQLMGQIRNMEDTISSILVALEYGPDMGTSYRLNQVSQATLAGDDAEGSQANLEGGEDPEETQEFFDLLVKVSLLTAKGYDSTGVVVRLGKLEELNLCGKNFTDTGVQELLTSSGSMLKDLDLGNTDISDAALAGVQLPKLEELSLYGCRNLTMTRIQELLTSSGSIRKRLVLGTGNDDC